MATTQLNNVEQTDAKFLIERALAEDLGDCGDLTSRAMIPEHAEAKVNIVARQPGVVSGVAVAKLVFEIYDTSVDVSVQISDGGELKAGDVVATVSGKTRSLLSGERTALNFLTHLSGIATLTSQFVVQAAGTGATLLDTRKTLPAYRRLQKFAVRCGGGTNHRMGLFDGILIKDNHLAAWTESSDRVADAVRVAREFAVQGNHDVPIEVEVDTLEQLQDALTGQPDIVLLDNMTLDQLKEAVSIRSRTAPKVLLEASGSVNLKTVRSIAETGVDRISVGALTHSAVALDLAFDWISSVRGD
jgi:nicotinate-nucleotide pyrophosphorylase (carboxylating)